MTISIFDDGEEYNISSSSKVYLSGEWSDKAVVSREVDSFTNNIIKVVFRNEEICAKGISKYKITIKDSDNVLSSVYFKIKVYENVYDENGILATPQYSELQEAIKKANSFVSTEDKDVAGGVPSLDSNAKVPVSELYEATTSNKGVTQLTDSVTSDSTTTAATPNSVKTVNDSLNSEISRATSAENTLTTNLNSEISRAKSAEKTNSDAISSETTRAKAKETEINNALSSEVTRATTAENNLESKKIDKTTVATSSTLGLVKSGTDITVDTSGNVSVNDNSHTHTVSNISDLTATASELNVLDGITATTQELNYVDGVTSNIQTQLDSKSVDGHTHDDRYYTESETDNKLKTKLDTSLKGSANGLAELDANGKVPSSQLPSYVDDVIEGYLSNGKFYKESTHTTEISGESGKIYIDLHTGKTYRWSGSTFSVISETLALGETSSTAYRGDRGKVAYDHSQSAHAPSNAQQNVQSDWNATSGDAFIKNKPTIPTKVSELTNDKDYATKTEVAEAIDDIEIGGRNLLVGTKDFNITNAIGSILGSSKVISEKYNGFSVRYYNKAWNFYRPVIPLKKGTYTFSTYVKGTDNSRFQININNIIKYYRITPDWEKYTLVFDVEEDKDVTIYSEVADNAELYQYGWKLENGNKPTPWTPAPEDTEAEIQAVDNKLTTNLLKPTLKTTTQNGVTCTNNGDGTYTIDTGGSPATGNTIFTLSTFTFNANTKYKLIGCPSGGSNSTYRLDTAGINNDIGNGSDIQLTQDTTYNIRIDIASGTVCDNLVFKPMLTTNLNATYDDFVPYTGSTGQLNSDVAEIRKDFDEHTHEIADVTGLQSALDGKLDKFASGGIASCVGNGKYNYFKITTLKITNAHIDRPIVFEMSGRGKGLSLVTIEFSSENNTDPTLSFFTSNCDNCFWIKKTTTSTWEVYGQYSEPWGIYTIHRITGSGANNGVSVTVNMENIDSLPSECTQVSYGGNVNYANSAGNADKLDGHNASAFATASHTHSNYLTGITKDMVTTALGYTPPTTDTDTWRGIQNNLTSDSTTDSLSAKQGKVLKGLVDGKADKEKYGDTVVSVGRKPNSTIGAGSFAFGYDTTASSDYSHAEGYETTASNAMSHAEGFVTTASANFSHAEGGNTTASGEYSHAEGQQNTASNYASHAEGAGNTASGYISHAEGNGTTASGYISHAEGCYTTALVNQHAQGHYNNVGTATENSSNGTSTGTAFVIGNGTEESKSNAFRVTGNGVIYATNAAVQSGADYAEYFEWSDGNPDNEDRVGLFVTFDESEPEKIRLANNDDYILGIVSGMPSVIGNGDEDWKKRYVLDDFGRYIQETFEYEEEGKTKTGTKWKENPEYDSTKPYTPRDERAEWSAIGLVGVLSVYDDGTCKVNGYCKCKNNGIATVAEKGADTYRVIKRVTDNIVKVVLK